MIANDKAISMTVAPDIERVLIGGDLSELNPEQRVSYYKSVCDTLGLNPLTRPFQYIILNGKLTLYARKEATDQIRDRKGVSIKTPTIQFADGMCIVSVEAHDRNGRTDSDSAVIPVENLSRTDRANAIMKTITKAKRRVTLSICGLGFIGEEDVEENPRARYIEVAETGELPSDKPRNEWHEEIDDEPTTASPAHNAEPVPGQTLGLPPAPKIPSASGKVIIPEALATLVKHYAKKTYAADKREGARGLAVGTLDEFAGDTQRRRTFLMAVFGVDSSKKLTDGAIYAINAWSGHPQAKSEVNRVIADYLRINGQTELPLA